MLGLGCPGGRIEGLWWGEPLQDWVVQYRDESSLPTLRLLIDDFWAMGDAITYPVSGHFTGWLHDTYGLAVLKQLYVAPDIDAAFQAELGMSTQQVEAAWLASLP